MVLMPLRWGVARNTTVTVTLGLDDRLMGKGVAEPGSRLDRHAASPPSHRHITERTSTTPASDILPVTTAKSPCR
jgi:hypothetical protein